jgi:hypothetical protein
VTASGWHSANELLMRSGSYSGAFTVQHSKWLPLDPLNNLLERSSSLWNFGSGDCIILGAWFASDVYSTSKPPLTAQRSLFVALFLLQIPLHFDLIGPFQDHVGTSFLGIIVCQWCTEAFLPGIRVHFQRIKCSLLWIIKLRPGSRVLLHRVNYLMLWHLSTARNWRKASNRPIWYQASNRSSNAKHECRIAICRRGWGSKMARHRPMKYVSLEGFLIPGEWVFPIG